MRLEDMKNDIPETPEFIHEMIQNEVNKHLQDAKIVNIRKRRMKKWTGTKMVAAVAICIMVTSTIAYAGDKLYHMFIEKQGTYSVGTGIKTDGSTYVGNLPKRIQDIDITAEYIPEGMEWSDETHLNFEEHKWTGGFSFISGLIDDTNLDRAIEDKNVVQYEKRTFGEYKGVYLKYKDFIKDGSFDQRIYLFCPDLYRVLTIYIGDDVAKDDAVKVAENLVITENGTLIETDSMSTWNELISLEESEKVTVKRTIASKDLPVYQIGDTFEVQTWGEDSEGSEKGCKLSVRVDAVQVEDNLALLREEYIPKDWKLAVGEDGKLVNNALSYIKSGDGVDTIDEIVKTESMKQKLVYATVTYTNETEEELNHILYLGNLILMDCKADTYQVYFPDELFAALSEEECDCVIWDGIAHDKAEMPYYSVHEQYGNGGNYIPSLKPHESIQVNMAWIVNENALNYMYLNLGNVGGAYEFAADMSEAGIVNIGQRGDIRVE